MGGAIAPFPFFTFMDYKLFQPSNIDLFREYPELKEYKVFVDVKSNDELLFAWHYGNPTSDIAKIEDIKERAKQAYEKVWGVTNDTKYIQYLRGDFPDQVRAAVDKMKSFKPSARMRAKMMTEKTFNDFEEIMHMDIGASDIGEMKKLADIKMEIASQLPELIKQMEGGFGIKEVDAKGKEIRTPTYADTIHDALSRSKN